MILGILYVKYITGNFFLIASKKQDQTFEYFYAMNITKKIKKNINTPKIFTISHRFEVTLYKIMIKIDISY